MDDASDRAGHDACPHVDRDDRRCSHRFAIQRIDEALCLCFGAYVACPLYHRINRELGAAMGRALALVTVTANGSPVRAAAP
jgi:hypothetical protein